MKSKTDSIRLATALLEVASANKLPASALITNMNQPTGRMVGNFLEILETVEVLKGAGPEDTVKLTVELGAEMMLLANVESRRSSARKRIRQVLLSGAGYENFCRYVVDCGGELRALEAPARIVGKAHKTIVKVGKSGYICSVDTAALGHLSGMLGAGRNSISDRIDPLAGMEILVRIGQKVSAGDELAVLYSSERKKQSAVENEIAKAFQLSDEAPPEERLILRRMTGGNG